MRDVRIMVMVRIKKAPTRTKRIALLEEIELYRTIPCVDTDSDPLEWWCDHVKDFPLLAQLAKRCLCIQMTCSPSKRLFSKAGQIIIPKEAHSSTQTRLICLCFSLQTCECELVENTDLYHFRNDLMKFPSALKLQVIW